MKLRALVRFGVAGLCMLSQPLFAATLTPEELLSSTRKHYPAIEAAIASAEAEQAGVQEARGAFDARVDQSLSRRFSGFYDGQQADTRIVKPLPEFNSEIYGGYRISDGIFPLYEDELLTNQGGEFRIGAQISLLRDRLIDNRRAGVNQAQIEADIADIELLLTQLEVHQQALVAYWRWVAAGRQLDVLNDMTALLAKRQSGLERRLARGDVAEIFLTENQQIIARLKAQSLEQTRRLQIAANQLSLYYRDEAGEPITPEKSALPPGFPAPKRIQDAQELIDAIESHPILNRLYQHISLQEQELALGENLLLPRADLRVELSDDQGSGSVTRREAETVAKLEVSIPLQRNAGAGKIHGARAEIKRLQSEFKLQRDRLIQQLNDLIIQLKTTAEEIEITAEEIDLAARMQQAERTRFNKGDSDFFLVNVRDQAAANAQIQHINAQLNYHVTLATLHALTLNQRALMLNN